jgi:anti-anti-sigma factor
MAEQARHPPMHLAPTAAPVHDPLEVEVHRLPNSVLLVVVRGGIDGVTAPVLTRRIGGAMPGQGRPVSPRLLLDLSGVTFLDHAGLDALLELQDGWGNAAGTVELLAPSPSVVRLLHEAERDGASWTTSSGGGDDEQPL